MTEALALTKHYFELSNQGRLDEIEQLFTESTTYSSETAGLHLGGAQIIAMQRDFFAKFETLHWTVHSTEEIRADIILSDFTFEGVTKEGERIVRSGHEYVVVFEGKLQHIEIRSKP